MYNSIEFSNGSKIIILPEEENIRSRRILNMVTAHDKKIYLVSKDRKVKIYAYINMYGKPYWLEDYRPVFLKEDKYEDYEYFQGWNV